jgi:hypothetical protein
MRRKIQYNAQRDYYVILAIDATATTDEIRNAYRRRVREVHPDLNPDRTAWATEQIQLINEAYGVLSDARLRKEYDRQRWPHIPTQPRPAYRSPFSGPEYDFNRPWWEQVSPRPAGGDGWRAGQSAPLEPERPYWLVVSDWLKAHHLGALDPTWLTLVGLWRSPYSGLLMVLAVVLALNVAVIIYAFIAPEDSFLDGLSDRLSSQSTEPITPTARPAPSATPDQLYLLCTDPRAVIQTPVAFQQVTVPFAVYGTVWHPELWHYVVELGYVGEVFEEDAVPPYWQPVRSPPANQSIPEPPVEAGILAETIDLSERPAGFYIVRLRVVLRNGRELQPCDVVVQY